MTSQRYHLVGEGGHGWVAWRFVVFESTGDVVFSPSYRTIEQAELEAERFVAELEEAAE